MSKQEPIHIQAQFIKNTFFIVIGILLLTFLFIQPYNIICRLTNRCKPITTSSLSIHKRGTREMAISFTAIVPDEIRQNIKFYPKQEKSMVFNGDHIKNSYIAENLTKKNMVIGANFDIKPEGIMKYLERVECICFHHQPLNIGSKTSMPLDLRINPKIEKDPEFDNVREVTVEYTIYTISNL